MPKRLTFKDDRHPDIQKLLAQQFRYHNTPCACAPDCDWPRVFEFKTYEYKDDKDYKGVEVIYGACWRHVNRILQYVHARHHNITSRSL